MKCRRAVVVHYDEIALKGGNRSFFERALINDMRRRMASCTVSREWGRIVITDYSKEEQITRKLKKVPGIATYGSGYMLPRDAHINDMRACAVSLAREAVKKENPAHFAVRVNRVDKKYPGTSQELERTIGEAVFEDFNGNLSVRLVRPDLHVQVEILHKYVLIFVKRYGMGGLPVGVSGRAVSLMSGGFDSPVATYRMIARGITPIAVHFHGMPKTSPAAVEKVAELLSVLSEYGGDLELFLVPVLPAMKTIAESAPEKLRLILLRRFMMRVATALAQQNDAHAIITGESVGQVASQTLLNLGAIARATPLPVLRPLSGSGKHEIIASAREIGTYDISARPHDDTCSLFVPAHPETKAKISVVEKAEEKYNSSQMVADALEHMTHENIAARL